MRFLRTLLGLVVPLVCWAQHATNPPAFAAAAGDAKRFQLAPGLKLGVWAAEPQLSNSVAFSIDGKGRIFLAESDRWAISVFDITAHTNWLLQDMSFRTVADRAAFLSNQFATNITFLTKDSEVVRRIEDRDGDGRADPPEIIATGFNSVVDGTAAGVLATGDDLYFANIPNLWKISAVGPRIADGSAASSPTRDPRPSTRSALATGFGVHIGVSGHDLHGLIKGPDGRIYMSFGDRGVCLTNREGSVINLPDCGGVLRCEPDGRDLELFCSGLRNPQELAFDDLGNLWTVDNDTAGADPCRVLHLVEGADYGWRTSYQHMDGFGPWVQEELWKGGQDGILPPAGTVSQGPSGLAYYPGTGFGERLAGTFLHCDFPGGVTSFTVKPRGASYAVDRQEKFLWNCWPTDVDFGPDGAVYVLDWVSGWTQSPKGRIYRITPTELPSPLSSAPGFSPVNTAPHETPAVSTASLPGAKAVETATSRSAADTGLKPGASASSPTAWRKEPELIAQVKRLLGEGMAKRGENELLGLLGHPDRRVRLEAQWELAGRYVAPSTAGVLATIKAEMFKNSTLPARLYRTVSESKDPLASVHALRVLEGWIRTQQADIMPMLDVIGMTNSVVRTEAVRVAGTAGIINALPVLRTLSTNASPALRFNAALALARLAKSSRLRFFLDGSAMASNYLVLNRARAAAGLDTPLPQPTAVDAFAILSANLTDDPFIEHAAVRILTTLGDTNSLAAAATASDFRTRRGALLALRRLTHATVTNFLSDPDPRLVVAAGRAIHDVPIVEGFPALAGLLLRVDCPTNLMSRVIDACARLGTPQHAQQLAGFAKRRDVPDVARALALRTLAEWGSPPPLDRVNGLWRPMVTGARAARPRGADETSPAADRADWPSALPADLGRSASFEEGVAVKRNDAPAKRAFLRVAGEIMDPTTPDEIGVVVGGAPASATVQVAVVDAAVGLRTKEASTPLFALYMRPGTPPEVRRAIVPALAQLKVAQAGEAVKLALADADPKLRSAALPHLDRLEGEDSVGLLAGLVAAEVTRQKQPPGDPLPQVGGYALAQAALAALAKLPGTQAYEASRGFLASLEAGRLPPELALDVREAARARTSAPSAAAAAAAKSAALRDTLVGGDASRGRGIFFGNQTVQCSRCHRVGVDGGTVGPKLDGIGKRQTRAYLLESIVQPGAKLADGFETVVLTLRDGRTLAGTLKRESSSTLEVEVLDDTGTPAISRVARADVAQRERGPSAMPEGLADLLTSFEIRDLVEYLASLK